MIDSPIPTKNLTRSGGLTALRCAVQIVIFWRAVRYRTVGMRSKTLRRDLHANIQATPFQLFLGFTPAQRRHLRPRGQLCEHAVVYVEGSADRYDPTDIVPHLTGHVRHRRWRLALFKPRASTLLIAWWCWCHACFSVAPTGAVSANGKQSRALRIRGRRRGVKTTQFAQGRPHNSRLIPEHERCAYCTCTVG